MLLIFTCLNAVHFFTIESKRRLHRNNYLHVSKVKCGFAVLQKCVWGGKFSRFLVVKAINEQKGKRKIIAKSHNFENREVVKWHVALSMWLICFTLCRGFRFLFLILATILLNQSHIPKLIRWEWQGWLYKG